MNTILDKWQEPNLKTKMNASKRSLSSSTRACDYDCDSPHGLHRHWLEYVHPAVS